MRRFVILLVILGFLLTPITSHAQISGAAVSMTCDGALAPEDPLAGGNESFMCTVSNPTAYVEKVAIQITSDGLASSAPGELYIEAGQEESFNVTIGWNPGMYNEVRKITVSVTVQELNNAPPPNAASSQRSTFFDLTMNYSLQGCHTESLYSPSHIQFELGNNLGNITFELNYSESPMTAANFAMLSMMGCYDNTTFHRVIDGFMIQAGDFTNGDGTGGHAGIWQGYCNGQPSNNSSCGGAGENAWTIPDEANGNLTHQPCMLSMAKTSAPNTGGSQFFVIPENSTPDWLDGVHTVFGEVVLGCDIVTAISETPTGSNDQPVNDIVIQRAFAVAAPDWDSDDDDVSNDDDNCPENANTNQSDVDNDSIGDACDDDLDGDGVNNDQDSFPNDANESADFDSDGLGDNSDADDDGDGMNDTDDAFPYNQNETTDTDEDGIGDNSDADDDGDGVADLTDNCPYIANTDQADADEDGIGSACDSSEEESENPSVPFLSIGMTMAAMLVAVLIYRTKNETVG